MKIEIDLFGPLHVSAIDGTNLTPKSSKAQGLIALLATGSRLSRSRTWLQSRLWSDRGREQGAGSLRQVLTEIRKSFGPYSEFLLADRSAVSFCPLNTVLIESTPDDTQKEFLEGLDIRDEAFEDWLRLERTNRHISASPSAQIQAHSPSPLDTKKRRLVIINEKGPSEGMEGFFANHFADSVARSIEEMMNVQVTKDVGHRPCASDLILRTSASMSSGLAGLRVSMERANGGQNLWSGSELVESKGVPPIDHENVLRLINNASEGISEVLYHAAHTDTEGFDATILTRRALKLMFSMRKNEQQQADGLLSMAFEIQQRGVILAWRVMLRILMLVEQHEGVDEDSAAVAIELAHRALELEPLNSMVVAAASNAALILEGDNVRGLELAERAVRLNPANPFALDCLSIAALYHGDNAVAHRGQLRARYIAGNTQFGHWFDMGCSMTAAISGDFNTASSMAQRAVANSPSFRPPLRYLIALYVRSGEVEKAQLAVEQLKDIEPTFTTDKLWDDTAYPVRDLRRSGLINKGTYTVLK
jgi:tetratricopeptide (TPR) repeat protein